MPSADLLHWIRRHGQASVKFLPVVVLTGYTQVANVTAARDSGANNVVKKPVVPNVLLDHLTWSARTPRPLSRPRAIAGPTAGSNSPDRPTVSDGATRTSAGSGGCDRAQHVAGRDRRADEAQQGGRVMTSKAKWKLTYVRNRLGELLSTGGGVTRDEALTRANRLVEAERATAKTDISEEVASLEALFCSERQGHGFRGLGRHGCDAAQADRLLTLTGTFGLMC